MNSISQLKLEQLKRKIKNAAQEKRKSQRNQGIAKVFDSGNFLKQFQNQQEQAEFFKKQPSRPNIIPQLQEWPPRVKNLQSQLYDIKLVPQRIINCEKEIQDKKEIEFHIQCMISQRNQDLQDDIEDQQKMKEMIVNTIRNKKPVRGKKRCDDPPTPFQQLSEPYQLAKIFAQYLPIYKLRRENDFKNGKKIIDLGVKYIHEIIVQCIQGELIPREYMKCYPNQKIQNQIEFVNGFSTNDLSTFNFDNILFTSLDHRYLCQMLIQKYPEKYTLGQRPYCLFKELSDFYLTIYQMEQSNYKKVLRLFRKKYNLYWWQQLNIQAQSLNQFQIFDDKFDTSTYYKPGPSPLFGANIDDPDNDFQKAKKRLYPNNQYRKLNWRTINKAKKQQQKQQISSQSLGQYGEQQDQQISQAISDEQNEKQDENQSDDDKKILKKQQQKVSFPGSVINSEFDFSYRKIFTNQSQLDSIKSKSKIQNSDIKLQSMENQLNQSNSKPKRKRGTIKKQIKTNKNTQNIKQNIKLKQQYSEQYKSFSQSQKKLKQNSDINQSSLSISKMSSIGHSKLSLFPNLSQMELKQDSEKQQKQKGKRSKKRGTGEKLKKRAFRNPSKPPPKPTSKSKSKNKK